MELIHSLLGPDLWSATLIIMNLILIESLLSIDNAAVLATMVMDLPKEQRARALRYGIIGAYLFRGICLALAFYLLQFWWLKPLGGAYLLWLAAEYFLRKETPSEDDDLLNKKESKTYNFLTKNIGKFWSTVILIEIMDLAFSIDNVLAAAAYTNNLFLVCTGVFIGILAMRFVASKFVSLLEKYPFLEKSAFIVLAILGIKLLLALYTHFYPESGFSIFMEGHPHKPGEVSGKHETVPGDLITSVITISVFVIPILTNRLLGSPKP